MLGLPIAFAAPWVLAGLAALPVLWWLLRVTPPRPETTTFPPLRLLLALRVEEETPAEEAPEAVRIVPRPGGRR